MNKFFYIIAAAATSVLSLGCGAGKDPGLAYMPDMYYSVAYETYAPTKALKDNGVNYNGLPVPGTVSREEDLAFHFDLKVDTTGYAQSAFLKNPLDSSTAQINMKEVERIYLINCGICHGSALDGNGPLFKGGDGPYTAAPRNLLDDYSIALTPGTMYYSITHGKGQMGSYASQLTPKQRWELVAYIKSKQTKKTPTASAPAAADSTATATAKK